MTTFNYDELTERYQAMTGLVRCHCIFATELVGGQPAEEEGIKAFVKYHLHLEGKEAEDAVRRIQQEELGEKDVAPEEGELKEKEVYGVNAIRRTKYGPFLGDWMIKACMKQSCSRLNIFTQNKGSKGDFAEAGQVRAYGESFLEQDHPERVYILGDDGVSPAKSYWNEFMGRVSTPQGQKSIIHHSECVAAGSRFTWEMRFLSGRVKEEDVKDALALMMVVGLGSARSLERGKFRIEKAEILLGVPRATKKLVPVVADGQK